MREREPHVSRRRVLQTTGATGAGAVAGCGGSQQAGRVADPTATTAATTGGQPDPVAARGRVPETADQAGIEALIQDGATILLEANTTYPIDDPPLVVDSPDVSILGSRSSVVRIPDGTMGEDDYGAHVEIHAPNAYLEGWTLDGNVQNQDIMDRYGLKFEAEGTHATVANLHNYNALGDAFGKVREGTRIVNCYARDFTADGIDFRAQGEALIANSVFVGKNPFKSGPPDNSDEESMDGDYWSGARVSNCAFIGKASHGTKASHGMVVLGGGDDISFRDFRFDHCLFRAWDAENEEINREWDGVNLRPGSEETSMTGFSFTDCTFEGGRGLFMDGQGPVEDFVLDGGFVDGTEFGIRLANASNARVDGPTFVGEPAQPDLLVNGNVSDSVVDARPRTADIGGTRNVLNGWGTNEGDPASTGAWNGEGYEGVNVYDTANDERYTYVGGDWR